MVRSNIIRGMMAERRVTRDDMCKVLGMTPSTFTKKMQTGKWSIAEAQKMIDFFGIKDPVRIFFAPGRDD